MELSERCQMHQLTRQQIKFYITSDFLSFQYCHNLPKNTSLLDYELSFIARVTFFVLSSFKIYLKHQARVEPPHKCQLDQLTRQQIKFYITSDFLPFQFFPNLLTNFLGWNCLTVSNVYKSYSTIRLTRLKAYQTSNNV